MRAHKELGNRWSEIAKQVTRRSENSVKNHWCAIISASSPLILDPVMSSHSPTVPDGNVHPQSHSPSPTWLRSVANLP